jgi:hypothetical protein
MYAAEPDECPEDFLLQALAGCAQDLLTAQASDRLDSRPRLMLRPYSSCMRWLAG